MIKSAVENNSLLLMHLLHLQNIKTPGEIDNLIIIEEITNNIMSFVSKLVWFKKLVFVQINTVNF